MLITNREDLAYKFRLQRSHGMTSLTYDRHQGHAFSYDVVDLGYNYRIDEIRSTLGLVQLKKIGENNAKRHVLTQMYWEGLEPYEVGLPFSCTERGMPSYHIFPILLPSWMNRQIFMERLRESGIQSSIHYRPIHTFSYYKDKYRIQKLPITECVGNYEVTLPLYPTMGEEKVQLVLKNVKELLAN